MRNERRLRQCSSYTSCAPKPDRRHHRRRRRCRRCHRPLHSHLRPRCNHHRHRCRRRPVAKMKRSAAVWECVSLRKRARAWREQRVPGPFPRIWRVSLPLCATSPTPQIQHRTDSKPALVLVAYIVRVRIVPCNASASHGWSHRASRRRGGAVFFSRSTLPGVGSVGTAGGWRYISVRFRTALTVRLNYSKRPQGTTRTDRAR